MHESHLVADLIARVESEVDPVSVRVSQLALRVGALYAVSARAPQDGIERHAIQTWGYAPDVVIEPSADIDEPGAMGVTLTAIQVEG
jgi:Zn finger protein HypA/HybF involved in hydrogenase expression